MPLDKIIFRNKDTYLKMYKGSDLIAEVNSEPALDYLTFTALEAGSTVKFSRSGVTSEYSTDNGSTWNSGNDVTVTLSNIGDKVMYRGVTSTTSSSNNQTAFTLTGQLKASGSVMSMINNNPEDTSLNNKDHAFLYYFNGQSALKDISELVLPATTLSLYCYSNMFNGCTGITSIPSGFLPATTLSEGCYQSMFCGCTGLTTLPKDLFPSKSTNNSCYAYTFRDCTGLTSAPINISFDNNSILSQGTFLHTFYGCTNLVTGPTFNNVSISLKNSSVFEGTFYNCSNLTTFNGYLNVNGEVGNSSCKGTFCNCRKLEHCGFINIGSLTNIGPSAFYEFMSNAKISSTSRIQRLYQPSNTIRVHGSSFFKTFNNSNWDNNVVSIDLHNYTFGKNDYNAFEFMFLQTNNNSTTTHIYFNSEDNLPTPDPTDNPNNDVPDYMLRYTFSGNGLLFKNTSYAPNFSKYTGQAKNSCYYRMFSNARSNYGQSGANWDIVLPNQKYNSGDNSYSYMFTSSYYLVNSLTYQLQNGDTSINPSSTHNTWLSDTSSYSKIFNCYEGGWDVIVNHNGRNYNTVPSSWTLNVTAPPVTDIKVGDITVHTKIGTGLDRWELWNDGNEPQDGKTWIRCSAENTSYGDLSYVNLEINNINHSYDYPSIEYKMEISSTDIRLIMTQAESGTTMNLPTSDNNYSSIYGEYTSGTIQYDVFYPYYYNSDTYNVTFALYCETSGSSGNYVALGIPTW